MSRFSRILLKLSGEMLSGKGQQGLDDGALDFIAEEVQSALQAGTEVAIVTGAGNLFRGVGPNRSSLELSQQRKDAMGMLATCMNILALQDRLSMRGVRTMHMSAFAGIPFASPMDSEKADEWLKQGGVVLFSGGTGLPYFSTDTAAAVRALQVGADALFKGTQVEGIYDRDPRTPGEHPPRFLEQLTYDEVLSQRLAVMDSPAIALCHQNGLPIVIYNAHDGGNLKRALDGTLRCSIVGLE